MEINNHNSVEWSRFRKKLQRLRGWQSWAMPFPVTGRWVYVILISRSQETSALSTSKTQLQVFSVIVKCRT